MPKTEGPKGRLPCETCMERGRPQGLQRNKRIRELEGNGVSLCFLCFFVFFLPVSYPGVKCHPHEGEISQN